MNENVIISTKEKAEKGTEKNGKKKHKKRAKKRSKKSSMNVDKCQKERIRSE